MDLGKLSKDKIEFELDPVMWLDREGYLRLNGEGIVKVEGTEIAKIKFTDSIYDPSIKASLSGKVNRNYKGIKKIIKEFNDKNNVEFLGREISGLVSRSDLVYRTTLDEAYIG